MRFRVVSLLNLTTADCCPGIEPGAQGLHYGRPDGAIGMREGPLRGPVGGSL